MGFADNPQNNILKWLSDMISIAQRETIVIPSNFRDQVLKIKDLLKSDTSGLVNSLLDFAVNCALVEYKVEAKNENLTNLFNDWLGTINADKRGKIPVGIKALAKEYFRERWKGGSFPLLRTFWNKQGDFLLPTSLFFVDSEDIIIKDINGETVIIGEEKYELRISKDKSISLPATSNEMIFIQKPFSSWGTEYPTPFLIQRGVFINMQMIDILEKKGEYVVSQALEHLMLVKKGAKELALSGRPEFIYSEEDLAKIKQDFADLANKRRTSKGISTYITNFDTEIEHIIPEYRRALEEELYAPIERRILAGLGLIEVVEGISSNRREAILNPKPFISEIRTGIEDFKLLLDDLLQTIAEKNKFEHRKYTKVPIRIANTPINQFVTRDLLEHLRSAYDRGILSKQTYAEMVSQVDYSIEVDRRKIEDKNKHQIIMYPPIIQNREADISPLEEEPIPKEEEENILPDRKGPESKNFQGDFEQAPYNQISELPDNIKNVMNKSLQRIWMHIFNNAYKQYKNEDTARKVAWSALKKIAEKGPNGKWHRKTKGNLEKSGIDIQQILEIAKLDIASKQSQLLNKLLGIEEEEEKDETTG